MSAGEREGGRPTWGYLPSPLSWQLWRPLVGARPRQPPRPGGATGGAKGQSIKIGFLIDKTGALAAYGYAHQKVGEATVKYINSHGGVGGRPLQLVEADTTSDPGVAATKARQLITSDHVDFLMGSNTSAVVLAVAPVAKELKTVYFPTAGGALLTEPGRGNRYVFDFNTDVKQEVNGVTSFIQSKLSTDKTWATVVVDYSWGWDNEKSFQSSAPTKGIQDVAHVRVPLGSGDWLTFIQGKIPKTTQGVYFANFGTDFLSFIQGLHTLNPTVAKIGANFVLSGQDLPKLGDAAEGMYVISGYPPYCQTNEPGYDQAFRQSVGMDCTGHEVGTGKDLVASYSESTWETLWAIKEVIEKSGWKSKADTPKFIQTLESFQFEAGLSHPGGAKFFRPEDHLSMKSDWMMRLVSGKLQVVGEIDANSMAYPSVVNYPQQQPLS